jgi:hypothetical protein
LAEIILAANIFGLLLTFIIAVNMGLSIAANSWIAAKKNGFYVYSIHRVGLNVDKGTIGQNLGI